MKKPLHMAWRILLVVLTVVARPGGLAAGTSWLRAAADIGGALADVRVLDAGVVQVLSSLCPGAVTLPAVFTPQWHAPQVPAPGSQVLVLVAPGSPWLLYMPDPGWTRWALESTPAYRAAVCSAGAGQADPEELRNAWNELLAQADQRTRDEASRVAEDYPGWATDLSETEIVQIIRLLTQFPTPDDEARRWLVFLNQIPPGPILLGVLTTAEASRRPFFREYVETFKRVRAVDPRFKEWCRSLPVDRRPDTCPSFPRR